MNNDLIIGSHVGFSSKNQLMGSVEEALSYGASTFMFYTGAPQNTLRNPIRDEYTKEAYKLMKEHNIDLSKVVIHAPYIVNLGNLENFDFSVSFFVCRMPVQPCATPFIAASGYSCYVA